MSQEKKDYAIQVNNLGLTIKKDTILSDVNIKLEQGKIHGLVGRNGSGKTMLMKCICGFVKPTSGDIYVDEKKIGKDVDFHKMWELLLRHRVLYLITVDTEI